jgi:outer membrane biosynthesis protein TonB
MNLTKEQRFGIISSAIFLVLFTGLLLLFGFSSPFPPPEEEGILINFGTSETGIGAIEPKPSEQPVEQVSVPEPVSTPTPVKSAESKEELVTQDYENTAFIEAKKKKEKEIIEDNKRKKENEEIERKKQEELEKQKKAEEERIRKEETQKAINERAKNAFGGKNPDGDNTGEGIAGGTGNQGRTDGDINSKNRTGGSSGGDGVSFSLAGRSHRSLPKPPEIHKTEGKIVVEVTVDQNGNVVSARAGVKGSTLSDEALLKVTREAALKATFDVNKNAPALQQGTITYFFSFE